MELTKKAHAYWRLLRPKTATSTILTAIGGSLYAGNPLDYGGIHIPLLVILGVSLAHLSVNALNDYLDYRSGLDLVTPRTPFSGGSKVLVDGLLSPREALLVAIFTLLLAFIIGLYLTLYRGVLVLVLAVLGALIIATYNKLLVKLGLGEVAVWLKGILVFIGSMYTISGLITPEAFIAGAIYGGFSTLVLYANFIPDVAADRRFGRRTLPVMLGNLAWLGYLAIALIVTVTLITSVTLGVLNLVAASSLLFLLASIKVSFMLRDSTNLNTILEALKLNVRICRISELLVTLSIIVKIFS